ncbi:MAG TPA: hypothetical protein VIL56_03110 [Gaiellaceae bacterium]|jgi:hypothetical protein
MSYFLVPLIVLGVLIVVFGLLVALSRIQNGRFLRPLVQGLAKVPWFRKLMTKASAAALEKQNPELASAMRKIERVGVPKTQQQAQVLMSRLSPAERAAYQEAATEQGAVPEPLNRQQRRAMEKAQFSGKPSGGGTRKKSKGKKRR